MKPDELQTITFIDERRARVQFVRVVVTPNNGPPVEAKLEFSPLTVGSDQECNLVVADDGVSRRHCELTLTPRGVELRDLGSKNGTLIGGIRVSQALLPLGVCAPVTIGTSRLVLQTPDLFQDVALSGSTRFGGFIGDSIAIRALFATLESAANSNVPVVIVGEPGTGKKLLAAGIHEASHRRAGPLVTLDCSSLSHCVDQGGPLAPLMSSGNSASALSSGVLERADGGTLILANVTELSLATQAKLLALIEARLIPQAARRKALGLDVRVIATATPDIRRRIAEGGLRQDLYYRLAGLSVSVPPLRSRREDIPPLVTHFLSLWTPERSIRDLQANTIDLLMNYDWPGNVRELQSRVGYLALFPSHDRDEVAAQMAAEGLTGESASEVIYKMPYEQAKSAAIDRFIPEYLRKKLGEAKDNVVQAAKLAGISRGYFHELMKIYGVHRASHGRSP